MSDATTSMIGRIGRNGPQSITFFPFLFFWITVCVSLNFVRANRAVFAFQIVIFEEAGLNAKTRIDDNHLVSKMQLPFSVADIKTKRASTMPGVYLSTPRTLPTSANLFSVLSFPPSFTRSFRGAFDLSLAVVFAGAAARQPLVTN